MSSNTDVQEMKTHKKLGFTHADKDEIVKSLNLLLCDQHVHYQKLRNFHWNVQGPDFYELHEVFEQQYNSVKKEIDEVAERIRVFDQRPFSNLYDYIQNSSIDESTGNPGSVEMAQEILDDYETLLQRMMEVSDAAAKIGDSGTIDLIYTYIRRLEKKHWMMTAWLKGQGKYK